jgi:hypothetical protein
MGWRSFYAPVNESLKELPQALAPVQSIEQAVASVAPIINVSGESILQEQASTPLATGSLSALDGGVACAVPVSAMPVPRMTDASRLCENVRRFI